MPTRVTHDKDVNASRLCSNIGGVVCVPSAVAVVLRATGKQNSNCAVRFCVCLTRQVSERVDHPKHPESAELP